MATKLRWSNPRCGREGFDARAGSEWQAGPFLFDLSLSTPDVHWNEYKPAPECLWNNWQWAVTSYGLEILSTQTDKCHEYRIAIDSLLAVHNSGRVYLWPWEMATKTWIDFGAFEEAFREALQMHKSVLEKHCRCRVDEKFLDTSFRRARGMRRRSARFSNRELKPYSDGKSLCLAY